MSLSERGLVDLAARRLSELLRQPLTHQKQVTGGPDTGIDGIASVGGKAFGLQVKSSGRLSSVNAGILSLQRHQLADNLIPLLVVPYMTPAGVVRCLDSGVNWLDLSGNASIHLDDLIIEIEGKPNAYPQRGRPASVFAPKSARISRWLLMHPEEFFSQRQLAQHTGMDEGFTSRIVSQMEDQQLIQRDRNGRIRARDCQLLLDAWAEEYDFFKHELTRGHVSARSGDHLLQNVAEALKDMQYAATGLAGAWVLDAYAGFRIVTIYGGEEVLERLKSKLFFRQEERGPNFWFVQPNDQGVFQGSQTHLGVAHVHPIQVWLDLKFHPERAAEAAEHLREKLGFPTRRSSAR